MKLVYFLIFSISLSTISAQEVADTISMRKIFGGYEFYHGAVFIKVNQVADIMQLNNEAFNEFLKSETNYNVGKFFGMVGGGLIGWPIGGALSRGKMNWPLLAVGAGVSLISIPFYRKHIKLARSAISIYNGSLNTSLNNQKRQDLRIGFTGNGIGLVLSF